MLYTHSEVINSAVDIEIIAMQTHPDGGQFFVLPWESFCNIVYRPAVCIIEQT